MTHSGDIVISFLAGTEAHAESVKRELLLANANVVLERRDQAVYAGLDWLIPPALVIIVFKKYIDTLLEEAARDHYAIFKEALKRVARGQPKVRQLSTSLKKLSSIRPGNVALFVTVAESAALRFVFAADELVAGESAEILLTSLPKILEAYPAGQPRNTVFRYVPASKTWELYDPLEEKRRGLADA